MIDGRVIRGVELGCSSFIKSFGRIKDRPLHLEISNTLRSLLLLSLDAVPRKLHMHPLQGKHVPSRLDSKVKVPAWSLHVTSDDRYKASFTFENGTLYFRLVDEHDVIDKNP